MNALERFAAALRHRPVDHVPVAPWVNPLCPRLLGVSHREWATQPELTITGFLRAREYFQLNLLLLGTDGVAEAGDFGQKILHPEDGSPFPDPEAPFLEDTKAYKQLKVLRLSKGVRMFRQVEICRRMVHAASETVPLAACMNDPLMVLSQLRGRESLMLDLFDAPKAVRLGLEVLTETLQGYCDVLATTGIEAVMIDCSLAAGAYLSLDHWRDVASDYLRALAEHARSRGLMVYLHNCGRRPYLEAVLECAQPKLLSFWHLPGDMAALSDLKRRLGSRTALMTGPAPDWLLQAGEDEVAAECRNYIDTLGPRSGFILSTGSDCPREVSLDKISAIVRTARRYHPFTAPTAT